MKTFLYSLVLAITLLVGAFVLSPNHSLAVDCSDTNLTPKQQIQCGVDGAAGGTSTKPAAQTAQDTVVEVINLLCLAGGALAVIMIIYGGLRYIISSGNQDQVKSAKNTIIYAIVGLVIIGIAQIIVQFVIGRTSDATAITPTTSGTSSTSSSGSSSNGSASHQAQ